MYISPIHNVRGPLSPVEKWSLDFQIDIFFARVDGWHLEIADRCINGWRDSDTDFINGFDRQGRIANYIADSGWAVLQIALNYFETIAAFKLGEEGLNKKHWGSKELFEFGFNDVFPEFKSNTPNIALILYHDLRGTLYHAGRKPSKIVLSHQVESKPVMIDKISNAVVIDPHLFVPKLREHLREYVEKLKHPDEEDLQIRFKAAFIKRYGG